MTWRIMETYLLHDICNKADRNLPFPLASPIIMTSIFLLMHKHCISRRVGLIITRAVPHFCAVSLGMHMPMARAGSGRGYVAMTASGTDRIQIFLKLQVLHKGPLYLIRRLHRTSQPPSCGFGVPDGSHSLTDYVGPKKRPGRKGAPTQASLVYTPC